MKTAFLVILTVLATVGVALGQAQAPYDYWVAIAQVPDVTTATSVIKKVVVFVGNQGPFGGPYYDVTLTVKRAGSQNVVCSAGLATQPPLPKGQQRNVLAFQVSYPKGRLKVDAKKIAHDKYVIFANISTQYPNSDTNAANGTQSKEISLPTGGAPECKPIG